METQGSSKLPRMRVRERGQRERGESEGAEGESEREEEYVDGCHI